MKILIVEDEPVAAALLAKILQTDGHKTTVATDGEIAWTFLDDPGRSFDVIFLDLSLPKLDGIALWERIRTSAMLRSIDVIPCTAANDRATVLKVAQLGAKQYLVKPCTPEKVRAKLQHVLQAMPVGAERSLIGY